MYIRNLIIRLHDCLLQSNIILIHAMKRLYGVNAFKGAHKRILINDNNKISINEHAMTCI